MQIANPIYDSVFKYIMNDSQVAKILLSSIIGEKIVELDFQPKDSFYNKKNKKKQEKAVELGFYYLDFNAKIETETGEYKTVIIELQKEKRPTDIVRFRQYLGAMYQSAENTYEKDRIKSRQIYCIYFLNYDVSLSNYPVIKVGRKVINQITGEEIFEKIEFIESLNQLSWIVQVKHIKELKQSKLKDNNIIELANVLNLFDQDNKAGSDHVLEIDEDLYSDKYRLLIRKLQEASVSPEVKQEMQKEDNYLTDMAINLKTIAKQAEELIKKDEELIKEREENRKQAEELIKKDEEIKKYKELIEKLGIKN